MQAVRGNPWWEHPLIMLKGGNSKLLVKDDDTGEWQKLEPKPSPRTEALSRLALLTFGDIIVPAYLTLINPVLLTCSEDPMVFLTTVLAFTFISELNNMDEERKFTIEPITAMDQVKTELRKAISRGAPVWNAGRQSECVAIYTAACTPLATADRRLAAAAATAAAAEDDDGARGWALRDAMDAVLDDNVLQPPDQTVTVSQV